MYLVEKHIIRKGSSAWNELDLMCFLGKNLWNSTLYAVRKHYEETGRYLNRFELIREFTQASQKDYIALPRKVSQAVIHKVDDAYKSFFALLKSEKNRKKARIPKYKYKTKGRMVLSFSEQAISRKELKKGLLKLSGCNFIIKVKHTAVKEVRVVPRSNCYVIEVVYIAEEKEKKAYNGKFAGIDLGVNNLATVTSNAFEPFIINGRPLKSMNQFYNKKKAKLQAEAKRCNNKFHNSRKLEKLFYKRSNKVNDYLHKASRMIVNHLVSFNITRLVVGYNKEWKQEANMRKKNNQNFCSIPHGKFVGMLEYKCKLAGITLVRQEESYTSKCSFFDGEEVKKHEHYAGKRVKRGLFKTSSGRLVNADVNGSLNIIRKAIPNAFSSPAGRYGIEVNNAPKVICLWDKPADADGDSKSSDAALKCAS